MIIAQGANIGGWCLYAKNGKLKYCYNIAGITYYYVESKETLPPGIHQVRMAFKYDGGGLGKGGIVSLFVDGKKDGEGVIPMTQAIIFPPMTAAMSAKTTGHLFPRTTAHRAMMHSLAKSRGVLLEISQGSENSDHLVSPEEAIRVAIAQL